jgi:hypothetical protein
VGEVSQVQRGNAGDKVKVRDGSRRIFHEIKNSVQGQVRKNTPHFS